MCHYRTEKGVRARGEGEKGRRGGGEGDRARERWGEGERRRGGRVQKIPINDLPETRL